MGLHLYEWKTWKRDYPTIILTIQEMKEIDKYFERFENP